MKRQKHFSHQSEIFDLIRKARKSAEAIKSKIAELEPPMIMLQCGTPESPQERANRVWKSIGDRMGFDFMSVVPNGKGQLHFSAEPK